ncbi:hypothetical protein Ddye_005728 [Dipteronia dyeriana]|uniref:Uncharacterized protein n=1 Tax=Dipteronia dyeriana TaxID=168575 RepID=A0AAD9XH10_9ROSI|nr:hypothetical protein Ddye_005728 [Dipteronia dyeriana]
MGISFVGAVRPFLNFTEESWLVSFSIVNGCSSIPFESHAIIIDEKCENWGPRPFCFCNGWLEDKELMKEVVKGWKGCKVSGSKSVYLATKLKVSKRCIKNWLLANKKDSTAYKVIEANLDSMDKVERKVLEEVFTKEEVWEAVSGFDGNKDLGLNGLNLNYIKANWKVIQVDFIKFIHGFHRDGSIVMDLSKNFVFLIPKCSHPETMKDFRPISLVGSMYKILVKVLANRLKKGSRVVLIKSVISSIPTYFMYVFKVSVNVALDIEKSQRSVFWGDMVEKRKLHVVDWGTVCESRRNDGLGILRIIVKNRALLAK